MVSMTDKEIRRLSKTELLTIIRDQENALEQKEKEAEQYRKLSAAQETSADPADSSDASPAVSAASSDTSDSSGVERPDLESLDRELARRSHRQLYRRTDRTTLWILIVAAAAAILIATLLLSALKVQGDSMEPTLEKDQILLAVRKVPIKKGDMGTRTFSWTYAASPRAFLYCIGLRPPRDTLIRFSAYQ